MSAPWKVLVFMVATGVLSISPLPLRAQGPEPGGDREIVVVVSDGVPSNGEFLADESPGDGPRDEREVLVEVAEDLPSPGERAFTVALDDPPGNGQRTKRIVIRTDGEDRPRLGVILRFEMSSKTDPKGAYVQGVTPGSPADEAGVRVGDIILKFNGKALSGSDSGGGKDQSAPAQRLVEMARNLGEGEKVSLEILRGDKTLDLDVVARKLEGSGVFSWHGDGEDVDIEKFVQGDFPAFHFDFFGEEWLDMELVSIDPDLGGYFGTTEGLLVVKAPADPSLGVKAGDLLQKVGDRKPTTPSQAFRILSSYEPGESVTLEVLRKQKHQTLQFKVPEPDGEKRRSFQYRHHSTPPVPPAPPTKEVRRG